MPPTFLGTVFTIAAATFSLLTYVLLVYKRNVCNVFQHGLFFTKN